MKRRRAWLASAAIAVAGACTAGHGAPAPDPGLPESKLVVTTATGEHAFRVWIAADDASRTRGLMQVREMPADRGMLFLFQPPQFVAFWMKETYLSLDLVFIGADGVVVNVAESARPLSLSPIESAAPVRAVLEVNAGTARGIGLRPGDRVQLPGLRTTLIEGRPEPRVPASRPPD